MQFTASSHSDPGKVRYQNDDAIFFDKKLGIFAIADGCGGHNAGGTASQIFCAAVEANRELLAATLDNDPGDANTRRAVLDALEATFQQATEQIYHQAEKQNALRGMATTGVILAIGRGGVALGHVGDSRAYLIRGSEIQQLTVDHTLAQEMLSQGLINEDELETFPHRNVLARALGQLPTVRVDTAWLDIKPGDAILLSTDGLHQYFEADALRELVQQGVEVAVEEANARGGADNISVVWVELEGEPEGEHDAPSLLDTQIKIRSLQDVFLFRYLNYQELIQVMKVVFEKHYAPGDVVFSEGEPGDTMYIVHEGRVEVMKGDLRYTSIGPGGNFGEIAFMDGHPRSAKVVASEPTTLLTINRDNFRLLTRTEPVIASKLLWCFVLNLSGRVRDLSSRLVEAMDDDT